MSTGTIGEEQILTVTERALAKILALREKEDNADDLALHLEISGMSPAGLDYTYDMFFESVADAEDEVLIGDQGGLSVIVPERDADNLRGATLDVVDDMMDGGLTLRNPNKPNPFAGVDGLGDIELTGEIEQQVQQLLDAQINPAIAAHGGVAQLVAVENDTAYVRLGGGCQGCGLASVTVTQGIETAVTSAIPAITRVIDTTDHASGTNPYYEPTDK